MKQQTLAMAADQGFEQYRKPTRRDQFLEAMNRMVAWEALCAVVEPHYPKRGNGRPPLGLERMLRTLSAALVQPGLDSQSGLARSAVVMPANVHDKHPLPQLLHDREKSVYGAAPMPAKRR